VNLLTVGIGAVLQVIQVQAIQIGVRAIPALQATAAQARRATINSLF
jgi:hypothetical protein